MVRQKVGNLQQGQQSGDVINHDTTQHNTHESEFSYMYIRVNEGTNQGTTGIWSKCCEITLMNRDS